jgi:nicotinamide-nucleotide amidase
MPTEKLASELLDICKKENIKISTAESCTGGMVAAAITDISGASEVFDRGFVTYSNRAKTEMLGVPADLITSEGAVSEKVAIKMAEGAIINSTAQLSISITGIAGPGGGTENKPVGLVYISSKYADNPAECIKHIFQGDRRKIRQEASKNAIILALQQLR